MATSEVIEASRPEPTSERPRRRLVRGDGHPPYEEEELQRFFTLGPEDVAFVVGTSEMSGVESIPVAGQGLCELDGV